MVQAFGAGLYQNVNNIIINGGNINAQGSGYGSGIGSCGSNADNIIINGGNIAVKGSLHNGSGINATGGKILITAGHICAEGDGRYYQYYGKANGIVANEVRIIGGVVESKSIYAGAGIACRENGIINLTGGNILVRGKEFSLGTYSESTIISYIPTDGVNNLYETQIKLQNIGENKKIESITTSDNIAYGVNDMYTLEDGMLYMYLPLGNREITIKVDGKTYKGEVETKEEENVTVLSEE